jgi:arylsulfatase A-like enzyme
MASPRPNVLVLHADQQRYDSLGCTGNPHARTPNLDRLAAEGTVFTRHIASNPVCMPSRASLFTGRYPPDHGVWSNGAALPRERDRGPAALAPEDPHRVACEVATLPDVFAAAGYDTVSFGKLHLTPNRSHPRHGFGECWALMEDGSLRDWHGPYYGFRHVEITKGHAEQPCSAGHYADWLEAHHPQVRAAALGEKPAEAYPLPQRSDVYASPVPAELHNTLWLADRFAEYLAGRAGAEEPFFAFIGFPDPHHALTPCHDVVPDFAAAPTLDPADPAGESWRGAPYADQLANRHLDDYSAEERRVFRRYTNAMVHTLDRAVGRVLEALEASNAAAETIVVFTSDHGDFLGDHSLLYKSELPFDSLLRVPFLLRAPGRDLPPRIDSVMSNCDVLPTLAGLCGVACPEGLHGRDVLARREAGEPHEAAALCAPSAGHRSFTLYDDRWRCSYYPDHDYVELFDHQSDPEERRNLAAEPAHRARAAGMVERLRELLVEWYRPRQGRWGAW